MARTDEPMQSVESTEEESPPDASPATYEVTGTSHITAAVNDVPLTQSKTNRLVFRPQIIGNNRQDATATIQGVLLSQKRHAGSSEWLDDKAFDERTMKSGEEVRMTLSTRETRALYTNLTKLYQLPTDAFDKETSKRFVVMDPDEGPVATGSASEVIQAIIEEHGTDVARLLENLKPDLFNAAALVARLRHMREAVASFDREMKRSVWDEGDWEMFFRANEWIFGQNLAYQYVRTLETQGHLGGTDMSGRGSQRTDWIGTSEAEARFSLLIDIKRPDTPLLTVMAYREPHVFRVSAELSGGTAQLQSYARRWVTEGVRQDETADALREMGISTFEPKGIIVIGNTRELGTDRGRLGSFEMFRRNVRNPEVITFDELYHRALHVVEHLNQEIE